MTSVKKRLSAPPTTAAVVAVLTLTLAACGGADSAGVDGGVGGGVGGGSSSEGPVGATSSPAEVVPDDTSDPPWPAPRDVPARVAAAGLDLGPMGTAEHYHPHLSITVDGRPVPVPPGIGVDPDTGAMSAVHTHEGDGTIHVEAHTVGEEFTLGQLFTQWGVALTPTRVGGVRAPAGEEVSVTSNGRPVPGDPADLRLAPDQRIELTVP